MSNTRKNQIAFQLFKAFQVLKEADMGGGMAQPMQQTPQAVANSNPMQPLPGQANPQQQQQPAQNQQQVVGSSGGEPMSSTGEPLSIDTIIDRLNVIRGGRSFSEPEVYGQLTTLYKGLTDQDKMTLDRVLTEIGKIVVQPQQPQTAPAAQMQGQGPATPPPGASSAPPQGGQMAGGAQSAAGAAGAPGGV